MFRHSFLVLWTRRFWVPGKVPRWKTFFLKSSTQFFFCLQERYTAADLGGVRDSDQFVGSTSTIRSLCVTTDGSVRLGCVDGAQVDFVILSSGRVKHTHTHIHTCASARARTRLRVNPETSRYETILFFGLTHASKFTTKPKKTSSRRVKN